MARTRKNQNLDEKIQVAQEKAFRLKDQYQSAAAELNALLKKKREMQAAEVMEAIENSPKSYEEILSFIKGGDSEEDQ